VTLEELYTGCLKKIMVCKKVLSPDGNTLVPQDKVLTVTIPPGTPDGALFTFPSEGDQGHNLQPGGLN
jgi:DnaJ family protein B protein 13